MPAAAPASTPSAPTAPTGATETFALAVPIVDDAGRSYRTLTLVEPSLRHDAQIARRGLKGASAQTAAMVAALSGVPESATINLKLRDARRLKHWLNATERRAVVADMAAELAI